MTDVKSHKRKVQCERLFVRKTIFLPNRKSDAKSFMPVMNRIVIALVKNLETCLAS